MDPFDLREWPGFAAAGGDMSAPAVVDQVVIDSRRLTSPNALFVALPGERSDGHRHVAQAALRGARYAIVSLTWSPAIPIPGISLLRVDEPLQALQQIAKSYRLTLPATVIAISGSFGKTMVKDLLTLLLETDKCVAASPESFNSQIGVPLSLLTIRKQHQIAIIEAAISKPGEMDILADLIRPDHVIQAPIGKKHLATVGDLAALAREMSQLILKASPDGWSLQPQDQRLPKREDNNIFYWDISQPTLPHAAIGSEARSLPAPYHITFPNGDVYLGEITTGYAYHLNLINMAVKAAWLMGISSKAIKAVLDLYKPEPMRSEIWRASTGATLINDTYCSDPQSIDRALRHFEQSTPQQNRVFVFGGMRGSAPQREADYRRIGQALKPYGLKKLILFGQHPFESLIEEVQQAVMPPVILRCRDHAHAVEQLRATLHSADYVLLKGEKKAPLDDLIEAFHDSPSTNQCLINLAAVEANIMTIRKALPSGTRMMVMVKAFAYGMDDVRMAKFLETCGIDILGVSYIDEGITLKRAGVNQAIFAVNAAPYEAAKAVKWGLEVGVSDAGLITALAEEASHQGKRVKLHLHINTGMGRFGCQPNEAVALAQMIQESPHLELEGVMTHFACADDSAEDAFTAAQMRSFNEIIVALKAHGLEPRYNHAANSSAAVRFGAAAYNMVRIGLAIYGLYASEPTRQALELRLALSLKSRIVGLTMCKKGESVSYGRRYIVERDQQKIAVLPIGYFDGLHRHYSGKCHVLIRGKKCPMVGTICMDYMMVDVTDIPNAAVGDPVLIFGEDDFGHYLSPEEFASSGNSIVYELITCLGPRIPRIFVHEEARQVR